MSLGSDGGLDKYGSGIVVDLRQLVVQRLKLSHRGWRRLRVSQGISLQTTWVRRGLNSRTFTSAAFTNSGLAKKHNLAKESAKKDFSHSKGKSSTKQANVPSTKASTSGRILEGNPSEFTGSGKGKKFKKGILSFSHSKFLLHWVNKWEIIECVDPNCDPPLTAASNNWC